MGYRLDVKNKPDNGVEFYGTKLYGYLGNVGEYENEKELDSYKYLVKIGKIKLEPEDFLIWDYSFANEMTLTADEFKEFITIYDADIKEHSPFSDSKVLDDENIKKLLSSPSDKVIRWE